MTIAETVGEVVALYPYSAGTDLPRSINAYLESIDADIIAVEPRFRRIFQGTFLETLNTSFGYSYEDYDCYILEDAEVLFTAPLIKRQNPDATIIYYFADHRPIGKQAYRFDTPSIGGYTRLIERTIDATLLRFVVEHFIDGILTNSTVAANAVQEFSDVPVGVVPTYVHEQAADTFEAVEPDIESNTAVTIARGVDTKGVDILSRAWDQVSSVYLDAELLVIGPNHKQKTESLANINYLGYVEHEEIADHLERCSLYIQPSRFDVFPKTVLEGMRAGLPPLVTNTNGAADAVMDVDSSFIVEPNADSIANRIISYFDTDITEREQLSNRSHEVSKKYTRDFASNRFEHELKKVCHKIDQ